MMYEFQDFEGALVACLNLITFIRLVETRFN